jgi:hypothetical protein
MSLGGMGEDATASDNFPSLAFCPKLSHGFRHEQTRFTARASAGVSCRELSPAKRIAFRLIALGWMHSRINVAFRPISIRTQWRSQERHVVFRKELADYFGVWWTASCQRPKLFIKLVSASRRIDHNDLARFIR